MRMKQGASTGKLDQFADEIFIGSELKEIGTGTTYVVNQYGGLNYAKDGQPCLKAAQWEGRNYELITKLDSAGDDRLKLATAADFQKETEPEEIQEDVCILDRPEPDNLGDKVSYWKELAAFWHEQYDGLTIAQFSDSGMVEELRHRGWTVECKRTKVIEL